MLGSAMRYLVLIFSLLGFLTGCNTSTCDSLKAHAQECDGVDIRYVDREQALCGSMRQELTPEVFDPFASCINASECSDTEAIKTCQETHVTAAAENPCLQYKLWSTACGLEPTGTEDNCRNASEGLTSDTFNAWVACMTGPGCPTSTDNRYSDCQKYIVPSSVTDALEACGLIIEWTEQCEGQTSGYLAVDAQDIGTCLIQTDVFTSASLLVYGTCLQDVECNDLALRLDCMAKLRFVDRSPAEAACESLIQYGTTCDVNLGFSGSSEICERVLATFTDASLQAYTECITSQQCRQPDLETCQELLVIKSN